MSYERKKRLKNIVTLLLQKETMPVTEIAKTLNVSGMTIRRDLRDLENEGLVKRTHGAATINNLQLAIQ